MKKGLMTTSALVAAGMFGLAGHAHAQGKAMNPVQLKVGGFMEQFVGYAFRDSSGFTGNGTATGTAGAGGGGGPSGQFDQQTEAEIHFTGQAKLDNGLQVRAHVEFEVTGSGHSAAAVGNNQIDEQTLTLRNGFGQLILGNDDPVASLMTTGYTTYFVTNAGDSLTYDVVNFIPQPAGFGAAGGSIFSTLLVDPKLENWDNDASKITYVSPRIGGLQVGVSYAPNGSQDLSVVGKHLAGHTGTWHNGWSLATNYTFAIDQFKLGVAAGYETAKAASGSAVSAERDPGQFGTGFRVDYGPYRFVFGWHRDWNFEQGNGTLAGPAGGESADGEAYNAGMIYRFGPNAISLTYLRGPDRRQPSCWVGT